MMVRAVLIVTFFLSIFLLPWFVSLVLGIAYLAEGGTVFWVVLGGVLMDLLSGAPVLSLFGFSYLYTLLALVMALVTLYLRQTLLE